MYRAYSIVDVLRKPKVSDGLNIVANSAGYPESSQYLFSIFMAMMQNRACMCTFQSQWRSSGDLIKVDEAVRYGSECIRQFHFGKESERFHSEFNNPKQRDGVWIKLLSWFSRWKLQN